MYVEWYSPLPVLARSLLLRLVVGVSLHLLLSKMASEIIFQKISTFIQYGTVQEITYCVKFYSTSILLLQVNYTFKLIHCTNYSQSSTATSGLSLWISSLVFFYQLYSQRGHKLKREVSKVHTLQIKNGRFDRYGWSTTDRRVKNYTRNDNQNK